MGLKEILANAFSNMFNPDRVNGPILTEDIAQQMRDEAEYGSMYLPNKQKFNKRDLSQSTTYNQRSTG